MWDFASRSAAPLRVRAAEGAVWTAVGHAGSGIRLLCTIVLARLLAPESFGLLAMAICVLGFARMFQDVGIHQAIIQRRQLSKEETSSAFWLMMLWAGVLTCLLVAVSPVVAGLFGEPKVTLLIALLSLDMVVRTGYQVPDALLRRQLKFKFVALAGIIGPALGGTAAIVLAFLGAGVWALVARALLSSVFCGMSIWLFSGWRPAMRFRLAETRTFIAFGVPLLVAGVLQYLQNQFGTLVIARRLDAEALGYFQMAFMVGFLVATPLAQGLARLAYPVFSIIQDRTDRLGRSYLLLMKTVALCTVPLALWFVALSGDLVPLILGPKWLNAVTAIRILGGVSCVQAVYLTVICVYRSQGRTDLEMRVFFIAAAVIVAAILVGVFWGLPGVCAGFAVGVCVVTPVAVAVAARLLNLRAAEVFRAFATPVWAGMAMGGVLIGYVVLRKHAPAVGPMPVILSGAMILSICLYVLTVLQVDKQFVPLLRGLLSLRRSAGTRT